MVIKKYEYSDFLQFSKKDLMYINADPALAEFYKWQASLDSFQEIMTQKAKQDLDRDLLVNVLRDQYANFNNTEDSLKLIEDLKSPNTFTIITAHQPSLLTGPLYYIFKICSAINLTKQLAKKYPDHRFIPLFITGGEDHDFEEINHLQLYNKTIAWNSENWKGGSVGQLALDGIKDVIQTSTDILKENSLVGKFFSKEIVPLVDRAENYSSFARQLTHTLFGKHGLIILSMDDPRLKARFSPLIKAEILKQESQSIVQNTQAKLEAKGWKSQAHVREINFFYRSNDERSRIERTPSGFKTTNQTHEWTIDSMEAEINRNPGAFSPNVVMRPLFQECILPNLAYIGGGGELAYWLERKDQFDHFNIPYPMLIRRNSAGILDHKTFQQIERNDKKLEDFFVENHLLISKHLSANTEHEFDVSKEKKEMKELMDRLILKATDVDKSLEKFGEAESVKIQKIIDNFEAKMKKSLKKQEEINIGRLTKIQNKIFPDKGLQERKENIFQYINQFGFSLIEKMIESFDPMDRRFMMLVMQKDDLYQE